MRLPWLSWMCVLAFGLGQASADTPRVWFREPATRFTEACPLGNGRLGALVFGGVAKEKIVLNDITLWSGSPQESDREGAVGVLPEIRRLLREGRNPEAQALLSQHFICKGPGSSEGAAGDSGPFGCYQVLGLLELELDPPPGLIQDYRRELDLDRAVARVSYRAGGVRYTREVFVSAPDQVVVVRLWADRPGAIHLRACLSREKRATTRLDGRDLWMEGRMASGQEGVAGMAFQARLRARTQGGTVRPEAGALRVSGADVVTFYVAAGTNYRNPAYETAVAHQLDSACRMDLPRLRARHVADHRRFFRRVSLDLGEDPAVATPERLVAAQTRPDPGLAALYFQYGRYLLISASRPDSPLPANLQGLWAEEYQTPWNGDYHLNINLQMAYWPAEPTGLGDCAMPLVRFVESLAEPGRRTAQAYYGAPGWAAHVVSNPWGFTSPGEGAEWGSTVTGGPWLCQHLYQRYRATEDPGFLARIYPVLKGSAEFCLGILVEEPSHGWWVTAPSNSPENAFRMKDGRVANTCMGPTMDSQIIRELFENTAEAARTLGVDAAFAARLDAARARLAPTRIGSKGQVMEWLEDYEEPEPHHRHVSHLFGLYPGREISRQSTPDLAAAARRTLELRGDASTGWSMAWKIAFWARLGDGERAAKLLADLLRPVSGCGGGTYPNLFCAHPPFQIDGNLGATAAIAEMLLQSRSGGLDLLPALPKAWPRGQVRGLRAPGGLEVDLAWQQGRLTWARIRSERAKPCVVRWAGQDVRLDLKSGRWRTWRPRESPQTSHHPAETE